jgi:superfamily II helicase
MAKLGPHVNAMFRLPPFLVFNLRQARVYLLVEMCMVGRMSTQRWQGQCVRFVVSMRRCNQLSASRKLSSLSS